MRRVLFKLSHMKVSDALRHVMLSCLIGAALFLVIGGAKQGLQYFGGDTTSYEAVAAARFDDDENLRAYNPAEQRYLRRVLANNPDVLLKMTSDDILAALSDPELARRDGDTVTWQYRSKSCVLDVFIEASSLISENIAGDSILHYEIRNRDPRSHAFMSESACVSDIIRHKSIPQMVKVGDFLKPDFKR